MLEVFSIKEDKIHFETIRNNNYLKKGLKLSKLDILFRKIEKNEIDSHCHLDHEPLVQNIEDILANVKRRVFKSY